MHCMEELANLYGRLIAVPLNMLLRNNNRGGSYGGGLHTLFVLIIVLGGTKGRG